MSIIDQRTVRVLSTILVFTAVLGFLYLARKPLVIFLFAMLFAYLLEPIIHWVEPRVRNSRGWAIVVVYVVGLVLVAIFGFVAGPRIIDEGRKLAQSSPELYQKIVSGNIAWQVGQQRGWSRETTEKVQQFLAAHRQSVLAYIAGLGGRVGNLAANAGWVGLIPILAVFFLKDKSKFSQAAQGLIEDYRERNLLRNVLADLDDMLAHFIRAQLYLAFISGAVYIFGMVLLRVPYAFILGTIGGLLEFIPVVGPLIAFILILGVAFTVNYSHMIVLFLFLGAWRITQDYVVSPRVLGGKVELHPLAAIFGVLIGGEIAGVVGVYLAIPAMATTRILWRRWHRYNAAKLQPVPPSREAA